MTADGKVIGCVWGAHRKLVDRLGNDAPTYDWCEKQWRGGLSKAAPTSNALPAWLEQELWSLWRDGRSQAQPTLWEAAS